MSKGVEKQDKKGSTDQRDYTKSKTISAHMDDWLSKKQSRPDSALETKTLSEQIDYEFKVLFHGNQIPL